MAKLTLDDILGAFASVTAINDRLDKIETVLNDNVLFRDTTWVLGADATGEPNNMENDLDLLDFGERDLEEDVEEGIHDHRGRSTRSGETVQGIILVPGTLLDGHQ